MTAGGSCLERTEGTQSPYLAVADYALERLVSNFAGWVEPVGYVVFCSRKEGKTAPYGHSRSILERRQSPIDSALHWYDERGAVGSGRAKSTFKTSVCQSAFALGAPDSCVTPR
ncbi:hypothetical protein D3C72_1627660 [compost metagenome]